MQLKYSANRKHLPGCGANGFLQSINSSSQLLESLCSHKYWQTELIDCIFVFWRRLYLNKELLNQRPDLFMKSCPRSYVLSDHSIKSPVISNSVIFPWKIRSVLLFNLIEEMKYLKGQFLSQLTIILKGKIFRVDKIWSVWIFSPKRIIKVNFILQLISPRGESEELQPDHGKTKHLSNSYSEFTKHNMERICILYGVMCNVFIFGQNRPSITDLIFNKLCKTFK